MFAIREFRVLFVNRCAVYISIAASGLAMGTITYDATGSAVLTGLSMFGGPMVSLVAAQFLLASSDSVRPRTALMLQTAAALLADALQCVPGMPWPVRFLLLTFPYVANSMFSGTQWVIVRDIVPEGSFVLARSALNLAASGMQVVGYGVGGLVLLWLSPRGLFCVAALADLASLINVRLGVRDRPAVFLFLSPPYQVTALLGFVASFGYSASLPLQERLIEHTTGDIRGQVMGLYSQGLTTGQSIGALIAGTVASCLRPGLAMGVMAAASITVTLALIPGLRRSAPHDLTDLSGGV